MKIVSDTGPLIGLAKIDKIYLLKSIAEEVLIPPMVHRELLGKVGDEADQIDIALSDFIQIKLVEDVGPIIGELRNKGYWISDEVINVARRLAGEE